MTDEKIKEKLHEYLNVLCNYAWEASERGQEAKFEEMQEYYDKKFIQFIRGEK